MNIGSDAAGAWAAILLSVALLGGYEFRARHRSRTHPNARLSHARLRAAWVAEMSAQPGFEIVAVQTLRNSLMSATISASTAALALMGSISLSSAQWSAAAPLWHFPPEPRKVLEMLLVVTLFASYLSSAMAMRFYNHAGFVMSIPVDSPVRVRLNPIALDHVHRAGLRYSWGLRLFLWVAPLVVGIANPYLMPLMTLGLIVVLHHFDRPVSIAPAGAAPADSGGGGRDD